jgi:hypothetical protein
MDRHLIERWTDTTAFGVAQVISGLIVLPVLAVGVVVSARMLVFALLEQTANLYGAAVVVLASGGAAGVFGWLRARHQARNPDAHDLTATLVCLTFGTATALAVGAIAAAGTTLTDTPLELWPPAVPFVAAQIVWVLCGIGWIQRLTRLYEEDAGRAFDGTPATLLVVTIVLATTATVLTVLL